MGSLMRLTRDRPSRRFGMAARLFATLLLLLAPVCMLSAVETRNFDHITTGFELLGQHRYVACEACHANAIFKGTPTACGACHGIGTAVRASAKPATHILSTDQCQACHTPWSWNPAVDFDHTQVLGSCSTCHNGVTAQGKGPTHIQTDLECNVCHTTLSWAGAVFVHVGITSGCAACHNGVNAQGMIATHFPINDTGGTPTPCEGCHSPTNFVAWGPGTLINHAAVTAMQCATCHETAAFYGMHPSTNTAAGDSRPNATLDKAHPTTGDCIQCHNTTNFLDPTVQRPSNHIPTAAICSQCHTTANNWAIYDVVGTHLGATGCAVCHGPATGPFAGPPPSNVIAIVGWPGNSHFAVGSADCNGSGCHSTTNVNPGGFKIGTASLAAPTLTVAGHTTIAGAGIAGCQSCHETAPYTGMIASTTAASDSRPPTSFDSLHPTTGECGPTCHSTSPTFATNVNAASAKPSNHIPTTASCAQCHTTAGNYTLYSSPGVHTGVTGCATCHGATVASTFTLTTPVAFSVLTVPGNHIAFGNADCNGSGCHTTANVTPAGGGFKIGAGLLGSPSTPTLSVSGHQTIAAGGVLGCVSCHETAAFAGMTPSTTTAGDSRPGATLDSKHTVAPLAAPNDCGNCHVTTPMFASNLLPTAPKPTNHIPTTAPCAQCHTTLGNFAVYDVTGVHQGATTCLPCHGSSVGTFAGPPPGNTITIVGFASTAHFPIGSLDCNGSGCHTTTNVNPGGFKIGTASLAAPVLTVAGHTTIAGAGVAGCQGCHETSPYTGMIAGTAAAWGDSRPTTYDSKHPTTGDCNGCHTTTPTFSTNQSGSSAKPSNHIPTTAACAQCHTTAGNYVLYTMGTTGHTGITNGCATCHAYGLSFYNMAPPTLVQPPSGATGHIPSNPPNGATAIACELCHSPTSFTQPGGFSGTVMKHAYVTTMKCESCHETGMTWKTNTGVRLWVRPNGHHAGQDCGGSNCHNARDKNLVRASLRTSTTTTSATAATTSAAKGSATAGATGPTRRPGVTSGAAAAASAASGPFNHATATGTCVSCHNGTTATGKPASHITTTNNCRNCHTTLAWLPVTTVDHSQVIGTCVSCHNGTTAMGKPSSHIATTAGCEACHTTNGWVPARFDHAAVQPHTCTTCHNGVQAIGLPRTHIQTTKQCDTCHGTLAWKPALVDHSSFAGTACARCHNNVAATGLPPNHFVTHLDCSSCHSYPDWSVSSFHHVLTARYPGDHKVALTCNKCHSTNSEQLAYPAPAYAGKCAGCHAKDYVAAGHPKTLKGQQGPLYTVSELAGCTGACHVYSDATFTTIARSQPGHHRVTDAAFK